MRDKDKKNYTSNSLRMFYVVKIRIQKQYSTKNYWERLSAGRISKTLASSVKENFWLYKSLTWPEFMMAFPQCSKLFTLEIESSCIRLN